MEDAEIVALYWKRDAQAIEETANKYGNYCNAVAMNILGNQDDAAECVNDAYLNLWNCIPPHCPSVLRTFLGKLIRNISFNRYKKDRAQKRGMFVSRYWYADSVSNIARRYGVSENNVSVTLNRLRVKLKQYLLERGFSL